MKLSGVILAGGQNRRMSGRMKALLAIHNESFIERQIRLMKPICSELIIVTNHPLLFQNIVVEEIQLISDQIPGKGPLSGMHAAFNHAKEKDIWVVGCDMPFISSKAGHIMHEIKLKENCDAVIPHIYGKSHPLHGVYDKLTMEVIEGLLEKGDYQVSHFLQAIHTVKLAETIFNDAQIELDFITNINTFEEYEKAMTKYADKVSDDQ